MATEKIYLGSTGFAQVGQLHYTEKNEIECAVLMNHMNRKFGKRIEKSGGRLVWARQTGHDFGVYHEMMFYIDESLIKDSTWNLINDMEAFEWENEVMMAEMQALFEKRVPVVMEKIEKANDLDRMARTLEEAGAIVMLPDTAEDMIANPEGHIEAAKHHEKEDRKKSFKPIPLDELTEDMFMDSLVPACCMYGCEVEPDGRCPHGHPSALLYHGMI